jgi:putative transcriptional regulator
MSFGTLRTWGIALIAGLVLATEGFAQEYRTGAQAPAGYISGQLLVATPRMGDPRFARTVIYMVDHDAKGAMGLVINRSYGEGPWNALLEGFGVEHEDVAGSVRLHYGGPVDTGRGFVLHSTDYTGVSTRVVDSGVAFSTGLDVLEAVAHGKGPRRSLFVLGYAGWGPGQLEGEMAHDDWLTAPAEETLIFGDDPDEIWEKALDRAGLAL